MMKRAKHGPQSQRLDTYLKMTDITIKVPAKRMLTYYRVLNAKPLRHTNKKATVLQIIFPQISCVLKMPSPSLLLVYDESKNHSKLVVSLPGARPMLAWKGWCLVSGYSCACADDRTSTLRQQRFFAWGQPSLFELQQKVCLQQTGCLCLCLCSLIPFCTRDGGHFDG